MQGVIDSGVCNARQRTNSTRLMCDIVAAERAKLPSCSLVRMIDHMHS